MNPGQDKSVFNIKRKSYGLKNIYGNNMKAHAKGYLVTSVDSMFQLLLTSMGRIIPHYMESR